MEVVFDIGGTHSRLGYSGDGISVNEAARWNTPADFEEGMNKLNEEIIKLSDKGQISGMAGGLPGIFDRGKRKLMRSPHLPGWVDKPAAKKLEDMTGVKVKLENDAALGALGEASGGAGRQASITAYITVGTGIGGARTVDGKIDAKSVGFEPGHQIIDFEGQVGYWEDFASGTALRKLYGKPAEEIDDPAIWEKETLLLAIGLHNVMVLWSPDVIVLGGAVMNRIIMENLEAKLIEQNRIFPNLPKVVKAELGDKSGMLGAMKFLREVNVY